MTCLCTDAIEQWPPYGAHGKLDETSNRPDPGYVVGRLVAQLVRHVVLLEDAECVREA